MPTLSFSKYHGTGNDFILIDERSISYNLSNESIRALCDRHLGIGADGLISLRSHPTMDFSMLYYNSDGRPGTMCGNGGRVVSVFAHHLGLGTSFHFAASDGEHWSRILNGLDTSELQVEVSLNADQNWRLIGNDEAWLNTGSPHHLRFVADVDRIDVEKEGRLIRHSDMYQPSGVNVNFVQLLDQNNLICRTFERGVEAETLSCGTGVTAVAMAASLMKGLQAPVLVNTRGGVLQVDFRFGEGKFRDITLLGPVRHVFNGSINI